ncbi:hypothetical protein [Mucilaginibacter sp.]|uniref:hypothetical protein n=1 Tax=Mucilaginibacter sp. TaxID=1882438 RepID=UPI0035BBDED1
MEKQYTLWERIINDTPTFFKKAQLFGSSLVILSLSLAEIKLLPTYLTGIIASIGATMAAVAQFAVKQYETNDQVDHETH